MMLYKLSSRLGAALVVLTATSPVAAAEQLDQQQMNDSGVSEEAMMAEPYAQLFEAGLTGKLTRVDLATGPCDRGYPYCQFRVEIRTVDWEGNPTDTILGAGFANQPPPDQTPASEWTEVHLNQPAAVNAGTTYALVVSPHLYNAPVLVRFGEGHPGEALSGHRTNMVYILNGHLHWHYQWYPLGLDLMFKTYVTTPDAPAPPASCTEVRDADESNEDGDYALDIDGRSVTVTCVDMATDPKEYLTLPNTGGDANYSAYGTGQNTSSPAVKTWYTKVRFEPGDLTVDITDKRFSTSNGGWANFGNSYQFSWNYAHAADCVGGWSQTGRANVDLSGTPFAMVQGQFVQTGYIPAGTTTFSAEDQVVDLTGGGYCGDNVPENARLQLRWAD